MTRKPLPKAIRQPIANLRETGVSIVPDEEAPAASLARPRPEASLAVSSAPIANDTAVTTSSPEARVFAEKRRARAQKIVERHRNYAAVGGLVPVPVANIAGVTAVNLRMIKQLSDLYEVPFQRDRARAFLVGLVGGAVPTGIGTATSTTLMLIMPGGLLLGLGAAALTAGALTRAIGMVFVDSFEKDAAAAS
jgi:uncharacterized protein (DUF697 family)